LELPKKEYWGYFSEWVSNKVLEAPLG